MYCMDPVVELNDNILFNKLSCRDKERNQRCNFLHSTIVKKEEIVMDLTIILITDLMGQPYENLTMEQRVKLETIENMFKTRPRFSSEVIDVIIMHTKHTTPLKP